MTYKQISNAIAVISKFHYDEDRNMRPEVTAIDLERDRLLRLKQRKYGMDNLGDGDDYRLGRL